MKKFAALDSMRGLAALFVVLVHLTAAGYFYDLPIVRRGGVGVPLFFVLSGFVIAHAYGRRLSSGEEVRAYVIKRFGRLYPLHLITLLALVVLEFVKLILTAAGDAAGQAAFTGTNSLSTLAANVFLLHAVIPFGVYSWNGPSWSISVEFWTYFVFAGVALICGTRRLPTTLILTVTLGALMVALPLFGVQLRNMMGLAPLLCLFCFFLGDLTYQLFLRVRESITTLAPAWQWPTLGLAIIPYWVDTPDVVSALIFAVVIFVMAFENGPVSKGLQVPALQFLGKISYSIYMIHFLVVAVLNGVLRVTESRTGMDLLGPGDMIAFGPPGAMDVLAVVYVAIVIGLGWISYTFIEAPARDFFNKIADRQPLSAARAAAWATLQRPFIPQT